MTEKTYTGTHEGLDWRLRLEIDGDLLNPREEHDNLWTLVMKHARRDLGDKQLSGPEFQELLEEEKLVPDENCLVVPIYAYEHGGIAFSLSRTGQFADTFDAGQIGVAYLPFKKLAEELGSDDEGARAKAIQNLGIELETYGQYIEGDGQGFVYEVRPTGQDADDPDGWEEKDSCWGFYGSDPKENGLLDHLPGHVVAVIDPPSAPEPAPETPDVSRRRRRTP